MNVVLDTHILIRWANDRSLPDWMLDLLDRAEVHTVSSISAWEVFMLARQEQLAFFPSATEWWSFAAAEFSIRVQNLNVAIHRRAVELAWNHRDPADRWIVATAIECRATLLTLDRAILDFELAPCARELP